MPGYQAYPGVAICGQAHSAVVRPIRGPKWPVAELPWRVYRRLDDSSMTGTMSALLLLKNFGATDLACAFAAQNASAGQGADRGPRTRAHGSTHSSR